jgi:enoyl-CoA hydratase/carnithine racemase
MKVEFDDGIATITLDDGKVNALGHTLLDSLEHTLDSLESEAEAIILTGREGTFSGGFDLKEIKRGAREAAALANRGAELFHRLYGYPMPVIGACTGHAIAAGAFTLLCCDTRIGAGGGFKIGLNETAIGMRHLPWGHELIASRIPKTRVTEAVIQARLYSPVEAVDVGYLDEIVDAPELLGRCQELARNLKKLPKKSYAEMKIDVRKDQLARIQDIIDAEKLSAHGSES